MLGAYVRRNENPPKPKVKNKSIIFRPENWKWDDFDDMCSHMKRIVCKVRSDGYCLLNAVKDSLLHDYDNLVTLRKMKEEITKPSTSVKEMKNFFNIIQGMQTA